MRNTSINYLLVQMTQSAPGASSHDFNSSNATQGMHMGQFPWPHPAYIPYPGYAPVHYPYGVPPNGMHGAPPPYGPVVPSGANPPPKHSSAPSLYQPLPSIPFAGLSHQGYLSVPPPFVPQAPNVSVGQKRVAEDLQERDAKRTKKACGKIMNDPLFKPVLNRLGQPNGTFMCSKDGMVINPESYLKHIRTRKHLGFKLVRYKCPVCFKTYSRLDACKRHFYDSNCEKSTAGGDPPSFVVSPASTGSAPSASVTAPTMTFTFALSYPMFAASIAPPAAYVTQPCGMPAVVGPVPCLSQTSETGEAAEDDEDDDDADFWEANEIKGVDDM